VIAIRYSCVGLSLRVLFRKKLSRLVKSQGLTDFAETAEKLRLGALIPIAVVLALLSSLVILGDITSWATNIFPSPIGTVYTEWDLIAEQRKPDDLASVVAHFAIHEGESKLKHPINLYEILSYYDRQRLRLQNKFPERYEKCNERFSSDNSSTQALYGGFALLTVVSILQLVLRKVRPNWLWFGKTTTVRVIVVLLVLSALALRYRLQWEWSIERKVSNELQITADLLKEDGVGESAGLQSSFSEEVKHAQAERLMYRFWFARPFDILTRSLMNISYRQLN
jgi:hypothetical protein